MGVVERRAWRACVLVIPRMLSLFRLMRAGAELGRVDLETRVVVAVGAERALETRDFPRMFFKETILI